MLDKLAGASPVPEEPLAVLLIDESQEDRLLVERELGRHFHKLSVEHVHDDSQLEVALARSAFDVAITDARLGGVEGTEILRRIKAHAPRRPVIMFTANGELEFAVAAMKAGFDDYITKTPAHLSRIPSVVALGLARSHDRRAATAGNGEAPFLSEERFRQMAEAMPQIVFQTGPHGEVEYINGRWAEYTGLLDSSSGAYQHLVPPEDFERLEAAWATAFAEGTPMQVEFRLRRVSDGAMRWFLVRALPMRDNAGRLRGWVGTSTDIHDQKEALEALAEVDERKDRFLAVLAHELRNPLAPLRTSLDIFRRAELKDPMLHAASEISQRQLAQMIRLIDDLLDVSRIARDKIELQLVDITLSEVIDAAVEMCRPTIDAAQHRLVINLPAQPIPLHADRARLAQVFSNLLSNSCKFMPRGGQIEIRAHCENGLAIVEIIDNGIGIAPGDVARIFEMFSQVEEHGGVRHGGLGVGLALARQLVVMHGGSVRAASTGLGRGSTFTVELPLGAPIVTKQQTRENALAHADAPRRILIVDDNIDAARALAMLLDSRGHHTLTAHDGPSAIDAARVFSPDVIFMDIGMPEMNGLDATKRIRALPGGNRIVIVALTGWGQADDIEQTRAAGFDHHLVKPVDSDALVSLLDSLPLS